MCCAASSHHLAWIRPAWSRHHWNRVPAPGRCSASVTSALEERLTRLEATGIKPNTTQDPHPLEQVDPDAGYRSPLMQAVLPVAPCQSGEVVGEALTVGDANLHPVQFELPWWLT